MPQGAPLVIWWKRTVLYRTSTFELHTRWAVICRKSAVICQRSVIIWWNDFSGCYFCMEAHLKILHNEIEFYMNTWILPTPLVLTCIFSFLCLVPLIFCCSSCPRLMLTAWCSWSGMACVPACCNWNMVEHSLLHHTRIRLSRLLTIQNHFCCWIFYHEMCVKIEPLQCPGLSEAPPAFPSSNSSTSD